MSVTRADLKDELIQAMPPDVGDVIDWDDIPGELVDVEAGMLLTRGVEDVEALRREASPLTVLEDIPEWETSCGMTQSVIALEGTPAQRRAQIISRLRERGATTVEMVRAVMQPFLKYADSTQIVIKETDRGALRTEHTRPWSGMLTFPPEVSLTWKVRDDAKVSRAGAQVDLHINTANLGNVTATLVAPDGRSVVLTKIGRGSRTGLEPNLRLYFKAHAGNAIMGIWTLRLNSANVGDTVELASLFVEGEGRDSKGYDGLGAMKGQWGVVVEEDKLAPDADLRGALGSLRRINYATRASFLIRRSRGAGALPPGQLAAIPDNPGTIPDACIPGSI
jgi:subtilisin-like proprotein convertase family protein